MDNFLDCEHEESKLYTCNKCGKKLCKLCEKKDGKHDCQPKVKGK